MSDCSCGDWSADYDSDPLANSYEATASYDNSDVYQTASYDYTDYSPVQADYSDYSPVQTDFTYDTGTAIDDSQSVFAEPVDYAPASDGSVTIADSQSIFTQAMEPTSYDTGGGVTISNEGSIFDQAMQPSSYDTGGAVTVPMEGSFFEHLGDPSPDPGVNLDQMIHDIANAPDHPGAAGTPYVGTPSWSIADAIAANGYMTETQLLPSGNTRDMFGTYHDDSGRSATAELYSPVENDYGTHDVN